MESCSNQPILPRHTGAGQYPAVALAHIRTGGAEFSGFFGASATLADFRDTVAEIGSNRPYSRPVPRRNIAIPKQKGASERHPEYVTCLAGVRLRHKAKHNFINLKTAISHRETQRESRT